jgi:hypothetical protein
MTAAGTALFVVGGVWLLLLLFVWALNDAFHGLESLSNGPAPGIDVLLQPNDPTLNARWTSSRARRIRVVFEVMKRGSWIAVVSIVAGVGLIFA